MDSFTSTPSNKNLAISRHLGEIMSGKREGKSRVRESRNLEECLSEDCSVWVANRVKFLQGLFEKPFRIYYKVTYEK